MYKIMAVIGMMMVSTLLFVFGLTTLHAPVMMFVILILTIAYHMATLPEA